MWPPWPNIAVIVYYTYKLLYLFLLSRWHHIWYGFYFSISGFYDIACYPESYIFYFWSAWINFFQYYIEVLLRFLKFRVNYNFFTWYVQHLFINIKRSYTYTSINPIPWNKSFIFCWKMSGELSTPIGKCLQ